MNEPTETRTEEVDFTQEMDIIEAPRSNTIGKLTEALAKAQAKFLPIKRTENVSYSTTAGRKGYSYAPLDEVIEATRKALSENGLAILQILKLVGQDTILETLLTHLSGEWIKSESYVGKRDQPPQSEGSALTYKRRYSLSALLNVASEEDDDAQKGQHWLNMERMQTSQSKSKPSAKPTNDNLPEEIIKPPVDEIDTGKLDTQWLKESLGILQERKVKAWSNTNVVSYLKTLTGKEAKTILEAVNNLTPGQAQAFKKRVQEALEAL